MGGDVMIILKAMGSKSHRVCLYKMLSCVGCQQIQLLCLGMAGDSSEHSILFVFYRTRVPLNISAVTGVHRCC